MFHTIEVFIELIERYIYPKSARHGKNGRN